MARAAQLLPVLLSAAVGVGGCGDPPAVPVLNRAIGLKLDEYRILPQVVTAPAGPLRMIVRNRGILTHNVAIRTIPDDPDKEPREIIRTATMHPGERVETSFTIAPGTYRLICTIANHDDLGQTGTLIVR